MEESRPAALLAWMGPNQWLWVDALTGAGYGLLAFVALANGASSAAEWLAASVGAACLAGPLMARRRNPALSLLFLLATLEVMRALASSSMVMALPPIVLVLYTVAAERSFAVAVAAMMASCAAVLATSLPDPSHPGGIVIVLPVYAAAWALGAALGQHRRHLRVQLELQEGLRRAQAGRAELALADQRVRIARELHDVVAHGLSVITVQAAYARLVVDDPDEVRPALGSIETTGRQTLIEMRALLEVLRDGSHLAEPTLVPVPRIDDLEALIDRIREAGVRVALTRRGPITTLPALVELNAYRIVQEALTNVVKHAGQVAASVSLACDQGELTITVRDDGPRSPAASCEQGHGITGMRERARILGGTLRAGPRPDRGYEVVGRLPVPDLSAAGRPLASEPA